MPTEEEAKESLQRVVMTAYFNSCCAKAIEKAKSIDGTTTSIEGTASTGMKSAESVPLIADPSLSK